MKHVLVVLAVAVLALPAWAATANFSTTVDGAFDLFDAEGYGNAGYAGDLTARMSKGNQHMGFMGWTGATKASMASFVGSNTITGAYLNVRAVSSVWNSDWSQMVGITPSQFYNKAAVISMRVGNTGDIVENTLTNDYGCGGEYNGTAGPSMGVYIGDLPGTTQPVAWRMADTEIKDATNPRYANMGAGIDKFAMSTFAGQAWKRPSTGDPAGIGSGTLTGLVPGADVYWTAGTAKRGYGGAEGGGGDGLLAVEAALGFTNSQGNNDVARFTKAGQLVNTNPDGSFRWVSDYAVGDGWYKIPLTVEMAADLINNPECKGLAFSSYVPGGSVDWSHGGNDEFARHVSDSGAYLTLDVTPEPMTLTLLALGGLGLLRRRNA